MFSPVSTLFKYLAAGGGQEAGEGGGRAHRGQRQPAGRQARAIQVGKCRLFSLKNSWFIVASDSQQRRSIWSPTNGI